MTFALLAFINLIISGVRRLEDPLPVGSPINSYPRLIGTNNWGIGHFKPNRFGSRFQLHSSPFELVVNGILADSQSFCVEEAHST